MKKCKCEAPKPWPIINRPIIRGEDGSPDVMNKSRSTRDIYRRGLRYPRPLNPLDAINRLNPTAAARNFDRRAKPIRISRRLRQKKKLPLESPSLYGRINERSRRYGTT